MNSEQFGKIVDERIQSIQKVLGAKAKEYALGGDRLHNFKVAGRIKNESPAKALWGMAMKHLVSVEDLIEERLRNKRPMVLEKIGDLINYLILLEAVLAEKETP